MQVKLKKEHIDKIEMLIFFSTLIWVFGNLRNKIIDVGILGSWVVITAILLLKYKKKILEVFKKYKFIYLFSLLAGVSIIWSYDKMETVESFLFLFFMLNTFIYYCERWDKKKVLIYANRLAGAIVLINVVAVIFFRSTSVDVNWRGFESWLGIYDHKNTLGKVSIIFILLAVQNIDLKAIKIKEVFSGKINIFKENEFLTKNDVYITIINIIVPSIFIVFSKSSTALGILLILFVLLVVRNLRFNDLIFGASVVFLLAYNFILNNPVSKYLIEDVLNRNITLTGRTYIWEYTGEMIRNNLFFGKGYFHLWDSNIPGILNVFEKYGKEISNAHNAFYDTFARIGILGFILLILIFVEIFMKARKQRNIEIEIALIGVFLVNLFETSILMKTSWDFFLIILVGSLVLNRGEKNEDSILE